MIDLRKDKEALTGYKSGTKAHEESLLGQFIVFLATR